MKDYDVIIVGGGMVGLACAALLRDSTLKIAVVDKNAIDLDWNESSFDTRVSAINHQSQAILEKASCDIPALSKSDYNKMYVWDGESSSGFIDFSADEIKNETLGFIVENRRLRATIFNACQQANNIDFYWQHQCQSVDYQKDFVLLTMIDSDKKALNLKAKLMIAADGARSWLREKSDIKISQKDYQQKAIVCRVKTELPHHDTAYQRFDHFGPLAFLPLENKNYCSIVWSVDNDYADQLIDLPDEDFTKRLATTFEYKLGAIVEVSPRYSFPLLEQTAETIIAPRLALVGDAAHAIHPLAGQGVNLGFADAKVLAQQIITIEKKSKDIGLIQNLRTYQRQRASDIFLMKQSMMGFKKLFGSKKPAAQMIRGFLLEKANKTVLLKNFFVDKALGK